jgi:carbonic anhydrase/acetyltransferase-like protein (isoleucine patch superfamily)
MTKHFGFVSGDEIVIPRGRTVKRIRALVSMPRFNVKPGDLGGYVEKLENLTGNAWVSGNARVYGDARVSDNALVSDNARVSSNALVSDNAWVFGNAWVSDNAWVFGNARVTGNAQVFGKACVTGNALVSKTQDYLTIGPSKSSGRFTTAHVDEKLGVRVNCGCFSGSVLEFSQAIEETHASNKEHLEQYRLFCQLIAFNFGVEA